MSSPIHRVPCIVFSCKGAAEGDLNLVRALGRQGVPVTVIAEYDAAPALRSRYCSDGMVVPRITQEPEVALQVLLRHAGTCREKPVLIASADPDLLLLSRLRPLLEPHYRFAMTPPELVEVLTDKRKFAQLALLHDMPVPRTHAPASIGELQGILPAIRYPVVVKPSVTRGWPADTFPDRDGDLKALILDDAATLIDVCTTLLQRQLAFLVQEYIPGGDDHLFELQVLFGDDSEPLAWFVGQKIRTWPPQSGSGCFVRSQRDDRLVGVGIDLLRRIGYRGLADLDFKKHADSGEWLLLEINPRVSQWHILGGRCGIDLPYLAYLNALGEPLPTLPGQRDGIYYLHFKNDLRAFRRYRRRGEWSTVRYLRSLLKPRHVYQLLASDDPMPFLHGVGGTVTGLFKRTLRFGATASRGQS